MKPYEPAFEVGDEVRVGDLPALQSFRRKWKYHNPLQDDQMQYANRAAVISKVGIYHGGDIIYQLAGIPGVWHEDCLRAGGQEQ